MEQERLGVLSSNEAYVFHFKEIKAPSSSLHIASGEQLASVDEAGTEDVKLHLVYVWIGHEAGVEACAAARAQVGLRARCGLVGLGQ